MTTNYPRFEVGKTYYDWYDMDSRITVTARMENEDGTADITFIDRSGEVRTETAEVMQIDEEGTIAEDFHTGYEFNIHIWTAVQEVA